MIGKTTSHYRILRRLGAGGTVRAKALDPRVREEYIEPDAHSAAMAGNSSGMLDWGDSI
jgi:hypothetical protein